MGHKVHFIAPCGPKNPFFDPLVEKNRVKYHINVYFTCVIVVIALIGHQT